MKPRKLRHRIAAVASSLGVAAMAATLIIGVGTAGTASASPPTIPAFPTFGAYPGWLPANFQVSNVDHSEGSDTTLFMMQSISNLYAQAGLFPFSCQLTTSPQNQQCLTPANNSGNNPNNTQSDTTDNFAGSEELQGINDVGSGNGQGELCGTIGTPVNTTVDYARSSKPFGVSGCAGAQLGYAKDSVPAVDFRFNIDPESYGSPTGYLNNVDPLCGVAGKYPSWNSAGTLVCTAFPAAGIGPVAAGWLPGDAFNCTPIGSGGTNCSGTAFTDTDNTTGALSTSYRLWCQHGSSGTAGASQITDWGQLTNLSAAANGGTAQTPGNGAPIGVPIRIIGVNSGSGTAATFNAFAKSGLGSGNCTATGNFNENAASQGDPTNGQGPAPTNLEVALENDANQIGDFANADWPSSDGADQVVDIATSIYYMGNGPYNTNPNAGVANLEATGVGAGLATSFQESEMTENNVTVSIPHERTNAYPTSRTLFNIYRTDKVRASTGGFLNWLCDSTTDTSNPGVTGQIAKSTDHVNGGNFDTDLTNTINGQYGFSRLDDVTPELSASAQTTANGLVNPNGSCEANLSIASGGITVGSNVVTLSANVPSTVANGWKVTIPAGFADALPSGTTVSSVSTNTITLSNNVTAGTGGTAATNLYFPGRPPVLGVTDANS